MSKVSKSEDKTSQKMDDTMKQQKDLADKQEKMMLFQAQLEFQKAMAEMHAKSTKAAGEALKGLA
jgi:hypothetical protein